MDRAIGQSVGNREAGVTVAVQEVFCGAKRGRTVIAVVAKCVWRVWWE